MTTTTVNGHGRRRWSQMTRGDTDNLKRDQTWFVQETPRS